MTGTVAKRKRERERKRGRRGEERGEERGRERERERHRGCLNASRSQWCKQFVREGEN